MDDRVKVLEMSPGPMLVEGVAASSTELA